MTIQRKRLLVLLVALLFVSMTLLLTSAESVENDNAVSVVVQEGTPQTTEEPDETQDTVPETIPSEWSLKAQDGETKLYVDTATGRFAVQNGSGRIWWSVPLNGAEDPLAKGKNRTNQQSLMIIEYGDPITNDLSTVNSQAGAVTKKGVTVTTISNGVRIVYDFVGQSIRVPMEVVLKDGNLVASVITEEVEEYGANYLYKIQLLPFFGAGHMEEDGWMLVPDGSGGIINFNNGRQNLSSYRSQVYGEDPNATIVRDIEVTESIRLPFFGMAVDQDAVAAIITGNDALAWIEASVSGVGTSYNRVYASFTLRRTDTYIIGASTGSSRTVTLFSTAPLTKKPIRVEYHFLNGEEADLAGMATVCRENLTAQGMKAYTGTYEQPPVYIDVLGSVFKEVPVVGIPTMSVLPVTTFENCADMLQDLSDGGLENMIVRYTNWSSDLIRGKISDSANAESKLGGKRALKNLLTNAPATIYLENDFTYVSQWQLGYGRNNYAAKSISNVPTVLHEHDIATFFEDERFGEKWLLSPFMLGKISDKYLASYQKWQNPYLSLNTAGELLYSDYSYARYTRQDSVSVMQDLCQTYAESGLQLMFTGSNSYVAQYAEHIVDVPVASSGYDIIDKSVPFYQMVFHGVKLLGSEAINNAADPQKALLRAVQGGLLLHYSFISPEGKANIQNTVYDHLYRSDYTLYLDEAAAQYTALKPLYDRIIDQVITDYRVLAENVTLTVYEDGTQVVVNFSDTAFDWDGTTVAANDYAYNLG